MSEFGFHYCLHNSKTNEQLMCQAVSGKDLGQILEHIARVIYGQRQALGEADVSIKMHKAILKDGSLVEDAKRMESLSALVTMMAEHYNQKITSVTIQEDLKKPTKPPKAPNLKEDLKTVLTDPKKLGKLIAKLQELKLPDLEAGDTMLIGKWKNRRAVIKDFSTDEHGQPIAKTNKGDQSIIKGRIAKLMPDNDPQKPKDMTPPAKPEEKPVEEAAKAQLRAGLDLSEANEGVQFDNRTRFNWGYHDGASHQKQGGNKDRNRMGTKMDKSHFDQVYVHGFHKGHDDSQVGKYNHENGNSDAAWKDSGLKNGNSMKPHKLMGKDQKGKKIAPWMHQQ